MPSPNRSLFTAGLALVLCYFQSNNNNNHNGFPVQALDGFARPAWNLPPLTSHQKAKLEQRHPFLHQCESLLERMERWRGGSSYGDTGGDDWSRGYGNDAYPDDDGDGDYYGAPADTDNSRGTGRRPPSSYDDYEDYSPSVPPSSSRSRASSSSTSSSIVGSLPRILQYGDRKIGLALLTAGLAVTALGFTLFFNRALLRLGNLLFMAGVPLTVGPARTLGYLAQPDKWRATACLTLGIFLVFVGHPILGILAEVFGLLNIFGNLFPFLMIFVKQVPVLGPLLSPKGGNAAKKKAKKKTQQSAAGDDYYGDYDNDYYGDDYGNQDRGRRGGEDDYDYGQQQSTAPRYDGTEDDYRDRYSDREDDRRGFY